MGEGSLCGSVLVGELAPDLGCSFRRAFPTTMGIGRGFKLGVKGRGLTAREGISSPWTAQALEAQARPLGVDPLLANRLAPLSLTKKRGNTRVASLVLCYAYGLGLASHSYPL